MSKAIVIPLSSVLVEVTIDNKVADGLNVWNNKIAPVLMMPAIAPNATLIQ
jgi:hypothetical protein